jgi:outer membrane protein TolC
MALLSDVFKAKVYVEKARERFFAFQKDYETAKKALELVVGTSLGDFDVANIKECPAVELKGLKETALQRREDLKAMYERAKLFDEFYKLELSNNLPQGSCQREQGGAWANSGYGGKTGLCGNSLHRASGGRPKG